MPSSASYSTCPYNDLPDRAFFKKLGDTNGDLGVRPSSSLLLGPDDKVVSAGSCFAARIAKFVRTSGLTYLFSDDRIDLSEDAVREESPAIFSLRYGNIYTTRHLLQLLQRVSGARTITPPVAQDEHGRYRNLFRPSVLSYGTIDALRADDEAHLENVKTLIERATVFTFTLGLTEQWIDRETDITFPSAPGCGFGEFDEAQHYFYNSTQADVVSELKQSISLLREINPKIAIIFTLSPVPLVATYTNVSAVEATFYSKSLMRQALAQVVAEYDASSVGKEPPIIYFPSYEVIMNPHCIKENFAADMRSISEAGVERVMHHFNRTFTKDALDMPMVSIGLAEPSGVVVQPLNASPNDSGDVDPVCEEENIWNAYLAKTETD